MTIKKRFKCALCKQKYPITTDMLKDIYNITAFGDKQFFKAFNCPCCDKIYINTYGNHFEHESCEFFDK